MTVPEDDNVSNDSNDFTEVENGQINSKFISDRESRRSLTNSHLEKKKCDEYIPGTTSLGMSVFNLSNAIMGSGILGLAFALANTGILLFLGHLHRAGSLAFPHTSPPCLPCASESWWSRKTQPARGNLTELSKVLTVLSTAVLHRTPVLFALLGYSRADVDQHSRVLLTSVTLLSIYSINLLLICSKETGCMVYEKLGEQVFGTTGKLVIFGATSLQNTGGKEIVFCYTELETMLSYLFIVKNELPSAIKFLMGKEEAFSRSQKKMQMVSNISFFAMFVMYFLTAIFGYLTFYEKVQSDLLHKYQNKDDILILTVRLAVIVAVILTVPVLFFTVRSSLFELAKKTKFNLCRHVLVTFILLVIINLLVIFIPSMKDIFGVVAPLLKQEKETTERLIKKRVREKGSEETHAQLWVKVRVLDGAFHWVCGKEEAGFKKEFLSREELAVTDAAESRSGADSHGERVLAAERCQRAQSAVRRHRICGRRCDSSPGTTDGGGRVRTPVPGKHKTITRDPCQGRAVPAILQHLYRCAGSRKTEQHGKYQTPRKWLLIYN
ncbi:sodium-coupled neutral amino acid transporter 1 [Camelus ferus]|nr:sodium-coupled neutral amino acid transporter 1 [Camelus ferus]